MPDKPTLMAQALADSVGATKRQIQIWTDGLVLHCQRGTDRKGRGRQRLYDPSEKIFAAFAKALSSQGLPIGVLQPTISLTRAMSRPPALAKIFRFHTSKWYARAIAGKVESYVCVGPPLPDDGGFGFLWGTKAEMFDFLSKDRVSTIINVRQVVGSIT